MKKFIGEFVLGFVMFALRVAVLAFLTMLIWNELIVELMKFDFNTITFAQSFLLSLFTQFLFGGRK